jgi:hypothetical protein
MPELDHAPRERNSYMNRMHARFWEVALTVACSCRAPRAVKSWLAGRLWDAV